MRVLFCLLCVVFVAAQAPAVATALGESAAALQERVAGEPALQALLCLLAGAVGLGALSRDNA